MNEAECTYYNSFTCQCTLPNWSRITCWDGYESARYQLDNLEWYMCMYATYPANRTITFVRGDIKLSGVSKETAKNIRFKIKINDFKRYYCCKTIDIGNSCYCFPFSINVQDAEKLMSVHSELSFTITMICRELGTVRRSRDALSKRYIRYIDSLQFSDVSLRVFEHEKSDNTNEERQVKVKDCDIIHSHKVVLAAASPWFETLFTNGMHESSQKTMNVCDVKLDIFRSLINYCYTYKFKAKDLDDALEVLQAADRFQVAGLYEEAFLIVREKTNNENVWKIWEFAGKFNIDLDCMELVIKSSAILKAKTRHLQIAFNTEFITDNMQEQDLYEVVLNWAEEQKVGNEDGEDLNKSKQLKDDLAKILKNVRFSKIPIDYLYNRVEKGIFLMSIDGMKDNLYEAYRYYAMKGTTNKIEHSPRAPLKEYL
ncbi:MAG: hypothetical protein EXX96DRAFT_535127 [Benjaminiella poitrasii]|nr:MAG: hypothetical protein EXX96DRAFT_535127 [Benjaminiella poitrasii]